MFHARNYRTDTHLYPQVGGTVTVPRMADDDARLVLARAVREAAAEAGITQRELGAAVARIEGRDEPYTQAFVSDWMNGRQPIAPERLFAIETACGVRPGSLSRLVGYVPVDAKVPASVPDAISADMGLTPVQREDLIAQWEGMRRRTAERRQQRQQPSER